MSFKNSRRYRIQTAML
ncbi:hypothetical protein AB6A40_006378 [Gnathostoma spinigerum]|uniref:Uncharacterized protein n=1 Tax=Gnathostoma spinigerum TaxID=75299 RepID=A0ABD6EQV7_9BILA